MISSAIDDRTPVCINSAGERVCECEGHWHTFGCALFTCFKCGGETIIAPQIGPAYCPDCCPDHDYQYERGEGHRCVVCFDEPPPDYFDESGGLNVSE